MKLAGGEEYSGGGPSEEGGDFNIVQRWRQELGSPGSVKQELEVTQAAGESLVPKLRGKSREPWQDKEIVIGR